MFPENIRTQKQKVDFVRDYLTAKEVDWSFMHKLILNHPEAEEKIGVGIKEFKFVRNGFGKDTLHAIRIDDSSVDISWRSCATGKAMSYQLRLRHAMRAAISDIIIAFRNTKHKCELCSVENVKFEVDHRYHFELIAKEFIDKNYLPEGFDDHPNTHRPIFKKKDSLYEQRWVEFHNSFKDNLSLMCVPCHKEVTWKL